MIRDRRAQSAVWGFLAMMVFIAVASGLVDIYRLYAARNWAYAVAQEAAMAGASQGRDWSAISAFGEIRLNASNGKAGSGETYHGRDERAGDYRVCDGCTRFARSDRWQHRRLSTSACPAGYWPGELEQ